MMRCDRYLAGHPCGAIMREVIDGIGRLGFVCDACTRYARGICRDCPAPRVGQALRCEPHRIKQRKSHNPAAYARGRDQKLEQKRERYRNDPEFRRRAIEDANRRQRKGADRTDIDRAYDRARRRRERARKRQQRNAA